MSCSATDSPPRFSTRFKYLRWLVAVLLLGTASCGGSSAPTVPTPVYPIIEVSEFTAFGVSWRNGNGPTSYDAHFRYKNLTNLQGEIQITDAVVLGPNGAVYTVRLTYPWSLDKEPQAMHAGGDKGIMVWDDATLSHPPATHFRLTLVAWVSDGRRETVTRTFPISRVDIGA